MGKPCSLLLCPAFLFFFLLVPMALSFQYREPYNQPNKYEGSSELVNLVYHMGPVLASPIKLYIIWYGQWNPYHQAIIRDFLHSLSSPPSSSNPCVSDWWRTVRLYTDQTGANITANFFLSGEHSDPGYSHGKYLTRLMIQSVIKSSVWTHQSALPLDPHNGLYLVLTSPDVAVEDFCRAVCGFHYFTFPAIVGVTVPYAWVGHSGTQCPGMCAYPFAWPKYTGGGRDKNRGDVLNPPNGDVGTDGMVSVIAHELAEIASNPLVNAWYAGDDPTAPTEIADLCMGVYGSGAGGGYVGKVYTDSRRRAYNVYGVKGRRFLVQWVWDTSRNRCFGPNAID